MFRIRTNEFLGDFTQITKGVWGLYIGCISFRPRDFTGLSRAERTFFGPFDLGAEKLWSFWPQGRILLKISIFGPL